MSEQFVYFNDDMFITAPTKPEDFFEDGKPCDTVAQDCIFFGKDSAGFFNAADLTVVNSNFNKRECIKNNLKLCFNPKNGFRNLVRTALLIPWPWFPGFYYQHAANSFLKSTFSMKLDRKAIPRPFPPKEPFLSREMYRLELTNSGLKLMILPLIFFNSADSIFFKINFRTSSGVLKSSNRYRLRCLAKVISRRAINQVEIPLRIEW